MKNILDAPFLIEMVRTTTNMYNQGWDERNGGNISLLLSEAEMVKKLISFGIDKTAKNVSGDTAYTIAVRWRRPEIAALLK